MTLDLLANTTAVLVITIGLLAILGVVMQAQWTGPKSRRHPQGRGGRIRDDLICLAPMAPFFIMLGIGAAQPTLRDDVVWVGVFFVALVIGLLGSLLPPVGRARRRLLALQRYPSQ